MLGTPQFGDVKVISNSGIVGTVSHGTAVPENATTNLYGAVTELIASADNTQDSWGIFIHAWGTGVSATGTEAALDILIGGATDDVLVSSLLIGGSYDSAVTSYFFPVHIPAGLRIAARLASVRTAITDPRVLVYLYGGTPPPFRVGRKITTYGTKINDSRGLAVVPATSGGAASVTEMTASTTDDHFYLYPGFQASTDGVMNVRSFNVGIGVGADTAERIGTWWYWTSTAEHIGGPVPSLGAWRNVPSGSRLTLLVSSSGTNDTYDGHIYAVT
jgi:hypothetical protein